MREAGRLAGRRGKPRVASAAHPSLGDDERGPVLDEIGEDLEGFRIPDDRAHRDNDPHVLRVFSRPFAPLAVTAPFRHMVLAVFEIQQRPPVPGGPHDHISPPPAVAAVRPSVRNKLLPPKADASAPAVARLDVNLRFVDEFHRDRPDLTYATLDGRNDVMVGEREMSRAGLITARVRCVRRPYPAIGRSVTGRMILC